MDVNACIATQHSSVRRSVVLTALFLCLTFPVLAGGGPRNVAVVINYNSAASREIGRYYQAARGIPDKNVYLINCPDQEVVSWQICEKQIREPIRRFLSDPEIAGTIDYIVLTKGIPLAADYVDGIVPGDINHYYSVSSVLLDMDRQIVDITGPGGVPDGKPDNATTYAFPYGPNTWMTYGFIAPQVAWSSSLFDSNIPGDQYDINKKFYLICRLDAFTVDQVKAMIDRAVNPVAGDVFILDRNTWTVGEYGKANTRLGNLATSAYDYLVKRGFDVWFDMGSSFISDIQEVMGYFSWAKHDNYYTFEKYMSNSFLPGSIADTYWSYSGRTFNDPGPGNRDPLIADLIACGLCGAGAYVSEPQIGAATYANVLFDRYTKGYNMAESFYAACAQVMWKTVIIGDPLMAPYASPPIVNIDLESTVLKGVETVSASAYDELGIKKVEFYLDDTLVGVSTQPPFSIQLDTNEFSIGPHTLEAIAYENSAVATQGSAKVQVTIDNEVSAVNSIHEALLYADGQLVRLKDKIVTAGTSEIGDGFYIEEADRSCGVKIIGNINVNRGDVVTVIGTVRTNNGQRLIDATTVNVQMMGADVPNPLYVRLKDLGGAPIGAYGQPVGLGIGASNVSLLVKVVGRVTSSSVGEFTLTDGSVDVPVKVICPGVSALPVGTRVAVTGLCESEDRGSKLVARIRARNSEDIQFL